MRGETLTAREGYVYTDGVYFGRTVHLRRGDDGSGWQEIPEEHLQQVEEEDFLQSLRELGVAV